MPRPMRNPLAVIRTNLEVALADPDPTIEELQRTAEVVNRSVARMSVLVDDLLTYADAVKRDQLGVAAELLASHGAVSAQVARAMAEGARSRLGTTIAVSITGIAGPGGGSDEKPVGLTYVAVADQAGADVRRHLWTGDRSANKRDSAVAALELLLERLGS